MKTIHLFLLVLFLLLVLLRMSRRSYTGSFYEGFESGKSVVVLKAKWCGHCKTAQPEFDKMAAGIKLPNGTTVPVKILDADDDKEEVATYKVRGYPTILIMDGNNRTEHTGERTYESVAAALAETMA